jgi:hypothetical protein
MGINPVDKFIVPDWGGDKVNSGRAWAWNKKKIEAKDFMPALDFSPPPPPPAAWVLQAKHLAATQREERLREKKEMPKGGGG